MSDPLNSPPSPSPTELIAAAAQLHAHWRDFGNWLESSCRVSPLTAIQYVTAARVFCREVPDASDWGAVEEFFAYRPPMRVSTTRTAYKHCRAYFLACHDTVLPELTDGSVPLPFAVRTATVNIFRAFSSRRTRLLRWCDVVVDDDRKIARIYCPLEANHLTEAFSPNPVLDGPVPYEWVQALKAWGLPSGPESPLIPLRPGSSQPRKRKHLLASRDAHNAESGLAAKKIQDAAAVARYHATAQLDSPQVPPQAPPPTPTVKDRVEAREHAVNVRADEAEEYRHAQYMAKAEAEGTEMPDKHSDLEQALVQSRMRTEAETPATLSPKEAAERLADDAERLTAANAALGADRSVESIAAMLRGALGREPSEAEIAVYV